MDVRATTIAGVDEAGRGPLAGPVVAAAVVLNPDNPLVGLDDSKKISPKRREALYQRILQEASAWGIASASVAEIDQFNILQATLLAMQRAVATLKLTLDEAWVDGLHCPKLACVTKAIVRGDEKFACISAASILAKVHRDRLMVQLDQQYPGYGLAQHKGYGTRAHLAALQSLGPCVLHRRSFAPVRAAMLIRSA